MTSMNNAAAAYIAGWQACMAGEDGRFTNPYGAEWKMLRSIGAPSLAKQACKYAWDHGFLDAMEAEDGEAPDPSCAGYGGGAE
jgi:hypothetical protein